MHANCYEWFLVQTLLWPLYMSAYGTKRTLHSVRQMSAFGGKADITLTGANVRF